VAAADQELLGTWEREDSDAGFWAGRFTFHDDHSYMFRDDEVGYREVGYWEVLAGEDGTWLVLRPAPAGDTHYRLELPEPGGVLHIERTTETGRRVWADWRRL
jgi:hypothetical protein